MPAQTLQVSRALTVIPSDNAEIPYPQIKCTGINTSTSSFKLISSGSTFVTDAVQVGDIVYNNTDSSAATIISVDSENQVTLNANIFGGTSKSFTIYQGGQNKGCLIQTGGAGAVSVQTSGGDDVTVSGCVAGQYHPVHVITVYETDTTATLITAFW